MPSNTTEPETPESIIQAVYNNGKMSQWKVSETKPSDVLKWISNDQALAALDQFYKAKYEKDLREIIGEPETGFEKYGSMCDHEQHKEVDHYNECRNQQRQRAKALGYNLTEDKDE